MSISSVGQASGEPPPGMRMAHDDLQPRTRSLGSISITSDRSGISVQSSIDSDLSKMSDASDIERGSEYEEDNIDTVEERLVGSPTSTSLSDIGGRGRAPAAEVKRRGRFSVVGHNTHSISNGNHLGTDSGHKAGEQALMQQQLQEQQQSVGHSFDGASNTVLCSSVNNPMPPKSKETCLPPARQAFEERTVSRVPSSLDQDLTYADLATRNMANPSAAAMTLPSSADRLKGSQHRGGGTTEQKAHISQNDADRSFINLLSPEIGVNSDVSMDMMSPGSDSLLMQTPMKNGRFQHPGDTPHIIMSASHGIPGSGVSSSPPSSASSLVSDLYSSGAGLRRSKVSEPSEKAEISPSSRLGFEGSQSGHNSRFIDANMGRGLQNSTRPIVDMSGDIIQNLSHPYDGASASYHFEPVSAATNPGDLNHGNNITEHNPRATGKSRFISLTEHAVEEVPEQSDANNSYLHNALNKDSRTNTMHNLDQSCIEPNELSGDFLTQSDSQSNSRNRAGLAYKSGDTSGSLVGSAKQHDKDSKELSRFLPEVGEDDDEDDDDDDNYSNSDASLDEMADFDDNKRARRSRHHKRSSSDFSSHGDSKMRNVNIAEVNEHLLRQGSQTGLSSDGHRHISRFQQASGHEMLPISDDEDEGGNSVDGGGEGKSGRFLAPTPPSKNMIQDLYHKSRGSEDDSAAVSVQHSMNSGDLTSRLTGDAMRMLAIPDPSSSSIAVGQSRTKGRVSGSSQPDRKSRHSEAVVKGRFEIVHSVQELETLDAANEDGDSDVIVDDDDGDLDNDVDSDDPNDLNNDEDDIIDDSLHPSSPQSPQFRGRLPHQVSNIPMIEPRRPAGRDLGQNDNMFGNLGTTNSYATPTVNIPDRILVTPLHHIKEVHAQSFKQINTLFEDYEKLVRRNLHLEQELQNANSMILHLRQQLSELRSHPQENHIDPMDRNSRMLVQSQSNFQNRLPPAESNLVRTMSEYSIRPRQITHSAQQSRVIPMRATVQSMQEPFSQKV